MHPEVRRIHDRLDLLEDICEDAPAADVDPAEVLNAIAVLRQLLDVGGLPVALAISNTRRLEQQLARLIPDLRSRGGESKASNYMERDLALWRAAIDGCPRALVKGDMSKVARWLVANGKAGDMKFPAVRVALGRLRKKLEQCENRSGDRAEKR
jgi:hypothetical protein